MFKRMRCAVMVAALCVVPPCGAAAARVTSKARTGAAAWDKTFAAPGLGALYQRGKISDPKVAAARLYDAWRAKSRAAALRVATREAVDKLFGARWRRMKFEGCNNKEEGGFQCVYRDARLDLSLAMEVDGGASAGYSVVSVSFSSEE